jgi:hypothetical protein
MNQNDSGCPIQLDCTCVFYGTKNTGASSLNTSRIPNGASLATVLETYDLLIGQLQAQIKALQVQLNKINPVNPINP